MINWKIRFKHAPFMVTFLTTVVAFIYQLAALLDIAPPVTQDEATQLIGLIVTMLAGVGILVDPTTKGVSDSSRAMGYERPSRG